MKRLLLAPLLLLGLLSLVVVPSVKANEVVCFFSNRKEFQKCNKDTNLIRQPKYPFEYTYKNVTKKTFGYLTWIVPPYQYRENDHGQMLVDTFLHFKSANGEELEIVKGRFGYMAGRWYTESSLIIPSEKIISWRKYFVEESMHPVYQINYEDTYGKNEKIKFQINKGNYKPSGVTLISDILMDISKLKSGEIRRGE